MKNLKKQKQKRLKIKAKFFYIYMCSSRIIKCVIDDKCRLATELDIINERLVFYKWNANDNRSYYFVDEELGIEKRQRVFVNDIIAFLHI